MRTDTQAPANTAQSFEALPRRIFLDTCAAQTLRDYGAYIFDGEPISSTDRLHRVTNGTENIEALRHIFMINERAQFEWIVSPHTFKEAGDKRDAAHLRWIFDIADHSAVCLEEDGITAESDASAARLREPKFNYLGQGDRQLLSDAVRLRCEAFMTMERRLPRNAGHLARELGLRVLTPVDHWALLQPWAGLWL